MKKVIFLLSYLLFCTVAINAQRTVSMRVSKPLSISERVAQMKRTLPRELQEAVSDALPVLDVDRKFVPVHKKVNGEYEYAGMPLAKQEVYSYFELNSKYNTPLKRKLFEQSAEYRRLESDLYVEFCEFRDTPHYLVFELPETEYDLKKKVFDFNVTLLYGAYKDNQIDFGNFVTIKSKYFHEGSFVFREEDEQLALDFENAMNELAILVTFYMDEEATALDERFENKGFVCGAENIYIYNLRTKKVYKVLDDIVADNKKYLPDENSLPPVHDEGADEEVQDSGLSQSTSADQGVVEVAPTYPGGTEAFLGFVYKNLKYPKDAAKNGDQGKVIVSFVIDVDGSVTDAKIVRGVSPSIDRETLRVIKMSPKWTPGTRNGKPVRVSWTCPVFFKL